MLKEFPKIPWLWSKRGLYALPLDPRDAPRGESLATHTKKDLIYKIGPFFCDKSPISHVAPYEHAIDFLVPDGTLVYAARGGTVIEVVEHNKQYGDGPAYAGYLNYITIDHGDGTFGQYAHLAKNSPTAHGIYVGKKVVRKQLLGEVGKNGWVEGGEYGDHLHFMVFRPQGNSFISIPVLFETE